MTVNQELHNYLVSLQSRLPSNTNIVVTSIDRQNSAVHSNGNALDFILSGMRYDDSLPIVLSHNDRYPKQPRISLYYALPVNHHYHIHISSSPRTVACEIWYTGYDAVNHYKPDKFIPYPSLLYDFAGRVRSVISSDNKILYPIV